MDVSDVEKELTKMPTGSKVMPYLAILGVGIVLVVFVIFIWLSNIVAEYYLNPKLVRDGADVGSKLLTQLQTIQSTKAWLVPLTFVGLAFLLAAISASLTGIKKTLGLRLKVFENTLPKLAQRR